jgi:hypothetical protein
MVSDAVAAARVGDWDGCLVALIAAWRPERQRELAEMIERVGRRIHRATHQVLLPRLEELDLSALLNPSRVLVGLSNLEALRVRVTATMQEHVNYLLERKARAIVIVPRYELQLGSHVAIANGVDLERSSILQ